MASPLLTDQQKVNERIVNITYHDDSSDEDESHEFEDGQAWYPCIKKTVWNWIEFVVTLVQIFAALLVLTLTKDEQQPEKVYVILTIGYTCGCIATFPILCWRVWHNSRSVSSSSKTRIHKKIENLKHMIEYFFVGWVVMLSWHLFDHSSSLNYTIPHIWLCLVFLAISFIMHVFPNFNCALLCFLVPAVGRFTSVFDFMDNVEGYVTYYEIAIAVIFLAVLCICGITR